MDGSLLITDMLASEIGIHKGHTVDTLIITRRVWEDPESRTCFLPFCWSATRVIIIDDKMEIIKKNDKWLRIMENFSLTYLIESENITKDLIGEIQRPVVKIDPKDGSYLWKPISIHLKSMRDYDNLKKLVKYNTELDMCVNDEEHWTITKCSLGSPDFSDSDMIKAKLNYAYANLHGIFLEQEEETIELTI